MLPIGEADIAYLNSALTWTDNGDPNPNDSVIYDIYLGQNAEPPLVAEGLQATEYPAAS